MMKVSTDDHKKRDQGNVHQPSASYRGYSCNLERSGSCKYGKTVLDRCYLGDVDYLFVDMPPGTGDVPLTAFQSLPIEGIVIVTSPQDLVKMIVKKAFNMAEMMKIPVLGIVENYSYVKCPDCGKEIKVFGESHIDEIAAELKVPVLGKMPIDMDYATKQTADSLQQSTISILLMRWL